MKHLTIDIGPCCQRYIGQVSLCVFPVSFFEIPIFIVVGLWLYPEAKIVYEFLLSVISCGLGAGVFVG